MERVKLFRRDIRIFASSAWPEFFQLLAGVGCCEIDGFIFSDNDNFVEAVISDYTNRE